MITLMYSNFVPSVAHRVRLEALVGRGNVAVADSDSAAHAYAAMTQVVFGHRYLRQLLPGAANLRWVQTTAGGFDQLPWQELVARAITLTRNPLNSPSIAQHAIALAWALLRRLPQAFAAQSERRWAAPFAMLPLPRTALVLGLGAIGTEIAMRLRGLGLHVRGVARSGTRLQREACSEFLDAAHWRNALGDTDMLILALPLDAATRGCVGSVELAALPAHAIVVNIARDGVLDRPALIGAPRGGRLGGAALDVLDPVPPPDDPLWATPNLLITPKVAAHHPGMQPAFEAFAEAQLQRYLAGAPLEALVDWQRVGVSP